MFRTYSGWLAAGALLISMFAVDSIAGPTTPAQIDGCVYNATPPVYSDGQPAVVQCDNAGKLQVNATVNASITNPTVGAAVPATANYVAGNKGGLLTGVLLDGSGYLDVNCQTGCAGGSFNNNADNVATSSTNGQAAAWGYVWDSVGGNWDRMPGNVSGLIVQQLTAANLNATVTGTVAATQSGNWTVLGGTTAADGAAIGATNRLLTYSIPALSNGSSLDIGRAVQNSTNTAGTGIAAAGAMGQCDDTSPTAITENNFGNVRFGCADHTLAVGGLKSGVVTGLALDGSGNLNVNVAAGGGSGGTSSSFAAVFPATGTAIGAKNGANMVNLVADGSNNLDVNCVVGCSGGTFNNNADAVATNAGNGQTAAYDYLFNGATFDRLREAVTGANTVGTGIVASQILGQCLGTPGALTDTRFGNLAMNCTDHSLIVSGGLAQEATTAGSLGSLVFGAVTTAAPTYTTAKSDALSLNTSGGLRVDGSGVTQPVSGTVSITANSAVNEAQINGVTPLMGNGVTGTGSQRVTIASDNTAFSVNGTLQTQTDTVMVGGVNVKEINAVAPLMGNGVTGTGSLRVTLASDTTSNTNPLLVTTVPATTGGATPFTLTLANTTNATNIKASAGTLLEISGFNMSSATPVWVSFYNNAGTPTCGTGIIEQYLIPGNTTGAGMIPQFSGVAYSTGIAMCATTGIAGTGAPAAATYVVNVHYK